MTEKSRKQVVYGLWVVEYTGFGRWLEWKDVRLGGEPWDPHLATSFSRSIYIFSSHRSELVKVLKYMRGESLPEHVQEQCEETALANCIFPDGTKTVKIRKCVLPYPVDSDPA